MQNVHTCTSWRKHVRYISGTSSHHSSIGYGWSKNIRGHAYVPRGKWVRAVAGLPLLVFSTSWVVLSIWSHQHTRAPLPFELKPLLLTISYQLVKSISTLAWSVTIFWLLFFTHLTVFIRLPSARLCALTGYRQSSLGVHVSYELLHTTINILDQKWV